MEEYFRGHMLPYNIWKAPQCPENVRNSLGDNIFQREEKVQTGDNLPPSYEPILFRKFFIARFFLLIYIPRNIKNLISFFCPDEHLIWHSKISEMTSFATYELGDSVDSGGIWRLEIHCVSCIFIGLLITKTSIRQKKEKIIPNRLSSPADNSPTFSYRAFEDILRS